MRNNALLSAALLTAMPVVVQAEDTAPIIVTATRTAQTADESLASVTVIDRETIERQQPRGFFDLLRGQAGVGISESGPFGKTANVHLRGTASEHTLLLVDGVRMGSATTGTPSWQFLSPREIERIEIVRGPRTSLYGSDAIGGVIQVFTHQPEGPPSWHAFAGGGSFGTHEYGAGVSGRTGPTGYALSANHYHTDGIDVTDNGDRDGYYNSSLSARVSHELPGGAELYAHTLRSQGATRIDAYSADTTEFVQQASSAGIRGGLTPHWWSSLSFSQARDENENRLNGAFSSRFDTVRDLVAWQNDIALDRHLLTLGIDYQNDRVDGSTAFAESSRDNRGIYAQLQLELGEHALAGSIRHDDNEAFGEETTGQLAWGYDLNRDWRIRANYGTAFRAPDFNDLYYPFEDFGAWGNYQGNPALRPETSESYEVGLRHQAGARYLDLAWFDSRVEDLIEIAGFPAMRPTNVENAKIRGIELEGGFNTGPWRTQAALTYLDHEDAATGSELRRRPRATARLDVDRDFAALSIGFTVSAEGRRFDDADNQQRIPGYALLDLRASYRLDRAWTLQATVKNALDKEYETAAGFNQPGSAAYLSFQYQQ